MTSDPEGLARRAADLVASLAARAGRLVSWWLLVAAFVVLGSFWAGLEALDGGIRTVWVVLGAVFAWISIVGLIRLRWNLAAIRRNSDRLVDEVRRLVTEDPGTERVVVDAVEVGETSDERTVMVFSQQFSGLGGALGTGYDWTGRVVSTMRSGFFTLAKSIVIVSMFAVLGLIFLLALAI